MLNSKSAIIPDIYKDARIPHAAYRPTFVHSLAMVPIRSYSPIGAIGNYWAREHECTPQELMLLEALANTTAVAADGLRRQTARLHHAYGLAHRRPAATLPHHSH
jgi:hypothetical protein